MKVRELFEDEEEPMEFGETELLLEIKNGQIPIEYKNSIINGNFTVNAGTRLSSLENAPNIVHGDVMLLHCDDIKSLEGIGTKYLTEIDEILYLPLFLDSNMLGVLRIKNLKKIEFNFRAKDVLSNLWKVHDILNKYLKSGRNLRKCKLELEETGFSEYAKL